MDEVVNQKLSYYFKPVKELTIASVVKEGHLYVDFYRTKKSLRYLDSQAFILNYLREQDSNSLGFSGVQF